MYIRSIHRFIQIQEKVYSCICNKINTTIAKFVLNLHALPVIYSRAPKSLSTGTQAKKVIRNTKQGKESFHRFVFPCVESYKKNAADQYVKKYSY